MNIEFINFETIEAKIKCPNCRSLATRKFTKDELIKKGYLKLKRSHLLWKCLNCNYYFYKDKV